MSSRVRDAYCCEDALMKLEKKFLLDDITTRPRQSQKLVYNIVQTIYYCSSDAVVSKSAQILFPFDFSLHFLRAEFPLNIRRLITKKNNIDGKDSQHRWARGGEPLPYHPRF